MRRLSFFLGRARWALGAGVAVVGAACVLPAATLVSGTGGQGSSTTSASSSSGPGITVNGFPFYTYPSGTAFEVAAPSGTPGQRHLFHAANSWWLLFITSPDTIAVGAMSDATPGTWDTGQSMSLSYAVGTPSAIDGRTFGVDVQSGVPNGQPTILHVGLSSLLVGSQKKHGRGQITPGTLAFDPGSPAPIGALTTGSTLPDGTVTAVSTSLASGPAGAFDVLDFGGVATDAGSRPTAAIVLSDPPGDGGYTASGADLDKSGAQVATRAALPLGDGIVAIWNEPGAGLVAEVATLTATDAGWPLSSTSISQNASVSGAAWAACATSSPERAVVAWSDQFGAFHVAGLPATSGSTWAPLAAPDGLKEPPAALFLACGANRAYAFIVSPTDGSILWSTSTLSVSAWSMWSTLVHPPTAPIQRCYLSGYDRVASTGAPPSGQIGLLWTEGANCNTAPVAPALMVATVAVTDE